MRTSRPDADDWTRVSDTPPNPLDVSDEGEEAQALRLQVLRLRDELIGSEVKLGEARERVMRLEARCRRIEELVELRMGHLETELAQGKLYEEQVGMMLASTTWRVGRMFVAPSYKLRRMLKGS